jgi:hypothetical protein
MNDAAELSKLRREANRLRATFIGVVILVELLGGRAVLVTLVAHPEAPVERIAGIAALLAMTGAEIWLWLAARQARLRLPTNERALDLPVVVACAIVLVSHAIFVTWLMNWF